MALALYLVQARAILVGDGQGAQVIDAEPKSVVFVAGSDDINSARANAYRQAMDDKGNIKSMVIDDIKFGVGDREVKEGDVVSVHYKGTLQNGQEFDNSRKRGEPFEFSVGAGQVIEGWDKGLLGMKVGGERVLIIPPEMAYGENGVGPIPGNATLVFAIELVNIK